ncbi:MAG TPA: hypothetical protein PLH57_09795, partial [Oligoflexia bacterium]|nr:hypothetical protein [Oligoflexia bacterium]
SVSTLMVVVALMLFGGGVIADFAFTMFVGMLVGTYSSIFVASTVVVLMTEFQEKRARLGKGLSGKPLSKPV